MIIFFIYNTSSNFILIFFTIFLNYFYNVHIIKQCNLFLILTLQNYITKGVKKYYSNSVHCKTGISQHNQLLYSIQYLFRSNHYTTVCRRCFQLHVSFSLHFLDFCSAEIQRLQHCLKYTKQHYPTKLCNWSDENVLI